jgi:hypothetical protein
MLNSNRKKLEKLVKVDQNSINDSDNEIPYGSSKRFKGGKYGGRRWGDDCSGGRGRNRGGNGCGNGGYGGGRGGRNGE